MNIFSALFGIFRQRGLVTKLKEGQSLGWFSISAVVVAVLGGVMYGFAMGIGLGPETAARDAIKVGLIILLGLIFALPIFWLAYRLMGREERAGQVAAIPLTFLTTTSIVLAVTAPIVFILSLLAGFSPEAVYIHIVLIDLALLIGLYVAGMLIHYGFTADRSRIVVPNVISFLMLAVILIVLMLFFAPFLALSPTFSVGTDLLKDRLGIGVADKVVNAMNSASAADRLTYRFQTTNQNGDLERDYTITRLGDDYLIEVHLHAIPGEGILIDKRIWMLDGKIYNDFAGDGVKTTGRAEMSSFIDLALPAAVFTLPDEFTAANWRGFGSGRIFNAMATTALQDQARFTLESKTLRLSGLVLGSADEGLHAETRVIEATQATLDRDGLEASLNQAIVLGSVDRSDASMQDYVQSEAFFAVRFPRNWRAAAWDQVKRKVEFVNDCGSAQGCPAMTVSVFDLAENKAAKEFAADLATSLGRQPEYREVNASTSTIRNTRVGVVDYLFDRTVKGQIQTTRHVEYIFVGGLLRYHLDFSAPADQFESSRSLFEAMAGFFNYLQSRP